MKSIHILDLTIIIAYLFICVFIGFYKFKSIKTLRDFGLNNNSISTPVLVTTIFATYIGAGATIGAVSKVYSLGIIFAVSQLLKPLFWIIMGRIYANNIEKFKGCLSISEIMGQLYGDTARWITNIGSIILAIGITSIQIASMGHLLSYCLAIPYSQGVITGVTILVLYTSLGGIKAVTVTDIFQFSIFFIIMPVAFSYLIHDLDNFKQIEGIISFDNFMHGIEGDNLWLFLSLSFYSLSPGCGGAFIQKFLMAEDANQLKKALNIIAIIHVPFVIMICLIGFVIKIKYPNINPELTLNYFISSYLPIGFKGLLIAGMLAVIMSTADSWINNASITFAHDVMKKIYPIISDTQEVLLARSFTVCIGVISIILAVTNKGVLDLLWLTDNFWDPLILIPFIAGINKYRSKSKSYIVSVISALIFISLGALLSGGFSTISFCLGILGSAIGLFGTDLIRNYKTITFKNITFLQSLFKEVQEGTNRFRLNKPVFNINDFAKRLKNKHHISKAQYYTFSIFGIIYFLFPFFLPSLNPDMSIMESMLAYLYVLAAFICLILASFELWPVEYKNNYLTLYWYFALIFCLPFLSGLIFFINSSSQIIQVSTILSILLLAMLVEAYYFIVFLLIGIILAYILFKLIWQTSSVILYPHLDIKVIILIYAIPTFIIFIFSRNKEKYQQDETKLIKIFAGSIAHELHNPLASLNIISKHLRKDSSILDKTTISAMEDNVRRAQEIINNTLLNLRENFHLSLTEINIQNIIQDVLLSFPPNITNYNLIRVDKNINFDVLGDALLLKQVITNIVQNAIYYTKNITDGRIDIKLKILNNYKMIIIEDNGSGIQASNLDKIFQPFYTTKTEGNGIGLAFCKKALEAMNASIKCVSEYGLYTKFIIMFPNKYDNINC